MACEEFFLFLCGYSYQDTEEVEVLCSSRVVTALILEFGVPVQSVQVFLTKLRDKKNKRCKNFNHSTLNKTEK